MEVALVTGQFVEEAAEPGQGASGAGVGHSVEAHAEDPGLFVGDKVGREVEGVFQEGSRFVPVVGSQQGPGQGGELGFGPVGGHLDGVDISEDNVDVYYYGIWLDGTWWSSAEYNTYLAWYRYLVYVNSDVYRGICDKRIGFPVRCLRDD